jgi:two-component system response regulator HydG
MPLGALKSRLLVGVSLLVISSGVLISMLATHRYGRSLLESLAGQAQYLAHAVSLQAADMVLTNDMVALQKMLEHQLRSNPSVSYLFVLKEGQVVAHTFPDGIPADLVTANRPASDESAIHIQEIASTAGEYFLDMAVPIFEGKAGILRLGVSEKPHREQVRRLWVQMVSLTLAILVPALAGCLLFIRRITGPLTELAEAVDRVDRGEMNARVRVHGQDEVAALGNAFNRMVTSLQAHTRQLEEQALELARAHHQTRTFCGLVQEIGALQTLGEIGATMIERLCSILECSRMVLLLANDAMDKVFVITETDTHELKDVEAIQAMSRLLEVVGSQDGCAVGADRGRCAPEVAKIITLPALHGILPLGHENRPFGAILIACSEACRCGDAELRLASSMANQAAGVIRRALLHEEEVRELQTCVQAPTEFCGIISKNPRMQSLFRLIEDVAPTDAGVLIQGESGTGKELAARAIHQKSSRREKPFIVIDCSAYPATLLESELFGHERGAFTGAIRQKSGRFEQADGGTVFLDEIGEIPPAAQIKLLRVLQTHRFERIGGEQTLAVDVRVIAATNRNLLDEVKEGRFREDLYYRLNVIPIHLPALRERRNDIPLLARHFLQGFAAAQAKRVEGFSADAMRLLLDYSWPGNVRELENSIEHAAVLVKAGRIEVEHLPPAIRDSQSSQQASKSPTIAEHEVKLLQETMEECGWNKKEAARRLGISRSTLYEKLKRYGITRPMTH